MKCPICKWRVVKVHKNYTVPYEHIRKHLLSINMRQELKIVCCNPDCDYEHEYGVLGSLRDKHYVNWADQVPDIDNDTGKALK